jgi:hypothetical protein
MATPHFQHAMATPRFQHAMARPRFQHAMVSDVARSWIGCVTSGVAK